MPYKPKYCCQCGEKIERIDWKPWTSRRFCELCATEFGVYDNLSRAVFGISLLFGLFGIGIYLQKPEKPLSVAPNQLLSSTSNSKTNSFNQPTAPQVLPNAGVQSLATANNSVSPTKSPATPAATDLKIKQIDNSSSEMPEKIYFCGAMTKKGTMCSRRVRGGGRCWQHAGQTAVLPQEKLLASQ